VEFKRVILVDWASQYVHELSFHYCSLGEE
jgi:hypothetical protein